MHKECKTAGRFQRKSGKAVYIFDLVIFVHRIKIEN